MDNKYNYIVEYYHRNKNGHITLLKRYFYDYDNAFDFFITKREAILFQADKAFYKVIKCIDKDGVLYE